MGRSLPVVSRYGLHIGISNLEGVEGFYALIVHIRLNALQIRVNIFHFRRKLLNRFYQSLVLLILLFIRYLAPHW
jgi:hypothetical protein